MHSIIRPTESIPSTSKREQRPWKRAMLWLTLLGPFFFLSYGFANWWTARLSHVDSFLFEWERHIPFLDWTILPYMSIDAFYAASLFICATRAELDTHAKRLLFATIISVTGFLLFPLEFSFVRPATTGFNGALFNALSDFDKPFNQAPSLHISLLMLLWAVYSRHLRGAALYLMHFWFVLIGISVFTTYQHHMIDGVTGAMVGVICLYLFPDSPVSWSSGSPANMPVRHKIQRFYLVGAVFCIGLACLLQGWAWLVLWPGVALMLVSLAYAGFGISVFQKKDGKLSLAARILLAPYLAGAWVSSRWFTRKDPPSVEVVPGIWIGRAPGNSDWTHFSPNGVLDLTAEIHASKRSLSRKHKNVPMLDLATPSNQQLRQAVTALDALYQHAPVLVHCALGYSRSALVVSAWLLHRRLISTPEQAIAHVRRVRPQMVFAPAFQSALAEFYDG